MMKLPVVTIQKLCIHDGPGIRTTVFLKGCPLRCKWCHNPETWKREQEIYHTPSKCIGCGSCKAGEKCPTGALVPVSELMSIDEILSEVMRDSVFYGEKGGITISGGEPMLHGYKTIALLKAAKEAGITTVVETSGYFDKRLVPSLSEYTDILLWDFKDGDNIRHIENTGVSNELIIENLLLADKLNTNIVLKCILLNTINFSEAHLREVARLYKRLNNCDKVEFFSYHPMGSTKSERLGYQNPGRTEWIVSENDINRAKSEFLNYIK